MKTIREKISFRIYKKGRKWIQCYINYKIGEKEFSHQGKVLINDYLKTKNVGEWVNNLPAEISAKENDFSYNQRIEYTATAIESNPELPIFYFGKYKFENISSVSEKDLGYLIFMKDKTEGTVRDEILNALSDYKIIESFKDLYLYGLDVRRDQNLNPSPSTLEGFELFSQESFDDHDGCLVQRDIYKKI
ncbi:hypothetical protein [Poseidonibacter ostreae]|uniref:Uncharacterized protein n=1 Tax=Poseidonibacter ostreae TaxID=2654171 RepID=A0A6L4WU02_9BACT|nr:hypothetical protein [Poseidonibacter ostreae]KAB7889556.1 hypothetical protein GBG19_05735 [Poseidonibacter ostreae]